MSSNQIENVELPEVGSVIEPGTETAIKQGIDLIGHVTAHAEVFVGTADVAISKLLALKEGELLNLNESVDQLFSLVVNGKKVAFGNLVVIDDKFGFEVVETC